MKNICKNCKHWKNQQAELEYSVFKGICTCPAWKFDTGNEGDVCVLDRDNLTSKYMGVNRFESQSDVPPIGDVERSTYCFVTDEFFGCIHFKKK